MKNGIKIAVGLTFIVGGAVAMDSAVLTKSEIQSEKVEDYETAQEAPAYDEKTDGEDYIKETVLKGEKPTYYGDEIPSGDWAGMYARAAEEMGVDMKEVTERVLRGEEVNLAQEMRVVAKEKGMEVEPLNK